MSYESLSAVLRMSSEDIRFFQPGWGEYPKTEEASNASGVASSGIILGDFVSTMPLMGY